MPYIFFCLECIAGGCDKHTDSSYTGRSCECPDSLYGRDTWQLYAGGQGPGSQACLPLQSTGKLIYLR